MRTFRTDDLIDDEGLARSFLLGRLSAEEDQAVGFQLFSDDEYFAFLDSIRFDLMDEYVRGELSPADRARFEEMCLGRSVDAIEILSSKVLYERLSQPEARLIHSPNLEHPAPGPSGDWQPTGSRSSEKKGSAPMSVIQQHTLSPNEVRVIRVFGKSDDATVYELGNSARLSPSDVREAISGLLRKNLTTLIANGDLVHLTRRGRYVSRLLRSGKLASEYLVSDSTHDFDDETLNRLIQEEIRVLRTS